MTIKYKPIYFINKGYLWRSLLMCKLGRLTHKLNKVLTLRRVCEWKGRVYNSI